MRAGLTATLQSVLVIVAISSLPEPASAGSCSCTCTGARAMETVSYSLSTGSCSDLNGRSCSLRASDPAGQAAGISQSARLTSCGGWTDEQQRKVEEEQRKRQLEREKNLFKSRK
jgi:hypothetical protein